MKVSIIIPNYNHSLYLEQRIRSVLKQTYTDYEVIILDDCSTDNSREIIETFRGQLKVRQIVYNEQNSGSTFAQWKKGIELAQGELIWIAESDDWCEPGFLENLVPAFQNRPGCVLAFTQSIIVFDNGHSYLPSQSSLFDTNMEGHQFVETKMLAGNEVVNSSMAIFRKEAYYRISHKYLGFRFCGDWLFWIQVALQGQVYISGKVLNYFRKHGGDVSGKSFKGGLFYREYFQLLSLLVEDRVISPQKEKALLAGKLQQMERDSRIGDEERKQVRFLFKAHLGRTYYKTLFKSNLKKIYQKWKASLS
jgi:glycosyltransferase involved in cell wall biosynthesis